MKRTILILLFLTSYLTGFSQSSSVSYIPNEGTLLASTDEMYGYGGFYVGSLLQQPPQTVFTEPYPYVNRFGLNVALFKNGINLGGGAKVLVDNVTGDKDFIPHVVVVLHPIKLITRDSRALDFSFLVEFSNTTNYGFGVSIPFWLNRY
jgi:hypothetical protein